MIARTGILSVAVFFAIFSSALGQLTTQSCLPEVKLKEKVEGTMIPEIPDYGKTAMTGDWGGRRTEMAENGVIVEFNLTQIMQGNAFGGKDTNNGIAYSGSADLYIKFDTARLGLWPGGLILLHGETQFGHSINKKVGAIVPPNFDALLPSPDDAGLTTLSEFYITQTLSDKFLVVLGKVDGLSLADMNTFADSEKTQFMNTGLRVNPVLFAFAPYTAMTGGIVFQPEKWLAVTTAIVDSDFNGAATRTGFNTAFHAPDAHTILQEWDITVKPFGLTGHQRIGYAWNSRDSRTLDADRRLLLPAATTLLLPGRLFGPILRFAGVRGIARRLGDPDTRPDDWMFYYNFDQYLYTEKDDPTQGVGLFGRFGYSTGEANPIEQFYSIGVGGKGIIPNRDNDTFGLGYYLVNFSDDLPAILNVHSEQGVELYYNIEVKPWLHVTPDLQVIIDPGGGFRNRDVAVVYGVRVQMTM